MTKIEKNMAMASAKSLRVSPLKANLVLKMIRGKKAENAVNILSFSRRRISLEVLKILKSAIANAENNHQLDIDKLFVKEATVGKAQVLKRFRPRARGRSGKILKPFSSVKILVEEKNDPVNSKEELKSKSDQSQKKGPQPEKNETKQINVNNNDKGDSDGTKN
jgi:large subunit ribosomal protein L22